MDQARRGAPGRRFIALLVVIVAVGFAGRVAYVLTVTRHTPGPVFSADTTGTHRSIDEFYYSQGAIALAEGRGLKFTLLVGEPAVEQGLHPPLTIALLAPAAQLTDGNETAMRLTVALAGAGVIALLGLIGREIAGDRAGLLAAGIGAVYPNLWVNDGILLAETFGTLGTAATIFFTYRMLRTRKWGYATAAGVSSGFAMLARSELALLVPLLVVPAALLMQWGWRRRLSLAGVACAAAITVVAPWVAYDLSRFDQPVFLSYGSGDALIGANCPDTYSGPRLGYWNGTCNRIRGGSGDASVHAADERREALDFMSDHLDELPLVVAARVGRLWSVFHPMQMAKDNQFEGRPLWVSVAGLVMFFPLVVLAGVGAVILGRRRVALIPLLAPVLIATLTAAAFYGLVRFRAPAEVSLVALGAVALDAWITRLSARPARTARVEAPAPGGGSQGL